MERVLSAITNKGEVVTQAFTCITAVNPILVAGHVPVYGDIAKDNLSLDVAQLAKIVRPQTRAVVVQHTFGATGDVKGVKKALKKLNPEALVLEDAAHCLGMLTKEADVSFHSFGAEKLLASCFGGAVWVNPELQKTVVGAEIARLLKGMPVMSAISSLQTGLYPVLNGVANRLPGGAAGLFRSVASGLRLFVAPIMPIELQGKNFGKAERPSPRVISQMLACMDDYDRVCRHRTMIAEVYKKGLKSLVPQAVRENELPYVRFPIVMPSPEAADTLFDRLKVKGLQPGKWYRPLLFPGAKDAAVYAYNGKSSPVAEEVSDRIVNLPTGLSVTVEKAKDIIREVNA